MTPEQRQAINGIIGWAADIQQHNVMERNCKDYKELVDKGIKEIIAIAEWVLIQDAKSL